MVRPLSVVVVVAVVAFGACAPIGGPVVVEALVPDPEARGGSRLDDVTLESVTDLGAGKGELFDVRGGLKVNVTDLNAIAEDDFDEMIERVRGDNGSDVNARMSFDGTRYVADDYETLFYFSMFANFESAFAKADEFGDDSDATERKAVVGLFASVQYSEFFPVTLLSTDNAAYAPPVDGWLALRTAFQDGVPFAMHRGVIAHEFGHRLFFQNVFRSVDGGFEVWRSDSTKTEVTVDELREQMLLKGVDEGLADVFSMSALVDKDSINRAFTDAGDTFAVEALRRDVEGDFAKAATYDNLKDLTLDATHLESCGLTDVDFRVGFNFYCVGTVLAAAIWQAADEDADVLASELEPAIIRALPRIGEQMVNGVAFDVDLLLEPLAQELPPGARRDAFCEAAAARFTSLVDAGRIPTCL
ncbi:MAG: hypothetical protein Q8O67_27515 [Deltaproteobacteria bacterium]|nr:hypothetical protein [Deltaproteobacteria bacterium]